MILKKILFVCIVLLFANFAHPVQTFADSGQSVMGQIGKDGDYLAKSEFLQKVYGSPDVDREFFGGDIAISGKNAIVSSVYYIYFFEKDANGVWRQRAKFNALPLPFDATGYSNSVAISGNVAMVGATQKVYIYEKSANGVWTQKPDPLVAPDGNVKFGGSIALSGNTAIIGTGFNANEEVNIPDSVYIYERDINGNWKMHQKIGLSATEARICAKPVALFGNTAMVAADINNHRYICVFERDNNGVWRETQKITTDYESNQIKDMGSTNIFGVSIALYKNYAAFGSPSDDSISIDAGSVSIYKYTSKGWEPNLQQTKLYSINSTSTAFGSCLAMSEKYAFINAGTLDQVDIFKRNDTDFWQPYTSLKADPECGTQATPYSSKSSSFGFGFGHKSIVSDDYTLMISAMSDAGEIPRSAPGTDTNEAGAVYLYPISGLDNQFKSSTFSIPTDKKYLVFVIAKTSKTSGKDAIQFETVGLQRNTQNLKTEIEKAYPLSLEKTKYLEGDPNNYLVVDLAELRDKYLQECKSKFGVLHDGSTGDNINLWVGLKIRYIAPVTSDKLKDVYVTDGVTIVNVKPDLGGATINWTEINNDEVAKIVGYQVDYTETPTQPQKGINDLPILKVPYATKTNLSASKVYYVWVRTVNNRNEVSPWVWQSFSPKPAVAAITAESSSGLGTDGKPMYQVCLTLSQADAAEYKILRQVSGDTGTLKVVGTVTQADMVKMGFQYKDAVGLVKHQKYQYYVDTSNALGQEASPSQNAEVEIANIAPPECMVTAYPRPLEVQNKVTFQLGPMTDPEGDRLTYRLYRRVPGVGEGELIETWQPTVDNQVFRTGQFGDQSSYEWQIRCVETGIAQAKEVIQTNWQLLQVDTNGIIIICHNDNGINNWGTKKQPLQFSAEINSGKTFTDYHWDFGDGSTSVGPTATHTYTALTPLQTPYSVAVTAVDASQTKRNGSQQIRIVNTPKGKLYDSETWSGIHSLDGEVIVPSGLTLTIASGTQVQVRPNGGLKVDGKLEAVGGSQNTQMDSQEGSNLWKGIRFEENGSGILTGVTIGHADQGIYADGSCTVNLSDVTLQNCNTGLEYSAGMVKATGCKFLNNNIYGVKDNNDDNPYPALSNCLFKGNNIHYADSTGLEYSKEDVNAFQYNGNDNIFQ